MSTSNSLPKSVLVHGPMGCGKSHNATAIASALGLKHVRDDWKPGHPVPLLDTLVLTNAPTPEWHFKGRVMTYAQAMHVAQQQGAVV
ncbi:hypothetical protein [Pseudomonas sp. Marseille-P9899]|uniref:hypothetical protein n=1 Tax=Pseudomonas sp. Marseille-P9899 TaxID=2730401 RepID=UPI002115B8FB|nr:hypothetical protein [Pseudomonas sp. Marseille-P9899]